MKRPFLLTVVFAIILSQLSFLADVKADQVEPILSVKLKNYVGDQKEITIKPSGVYSVKDSTIKLEANAEYQVTVTSDGVALNKGSQNLGVFTSLEVTPSNDS